MSRFRWVPRMKINVLLVDDHAVVRTGYRALLENAVEIASVVEAESGEAACRLYGEIAPDVVIMDLSLPGISGLEAIRRIVSRDAGARVVVFSMHEDVVFVEQAMQAGARGYISKRSAPDVLVEAVLQIAAGETYLEQGLAERLAYQACSQAPSPFSELSTREFEIVSLLARGVTPQDIANRLSLSYKTIANYSTQIKNKLKVTSTAELTRLAIRHGIVEI